jgi:hypothetical protein
MHGSGTFAWRDGRTYTGNYVEGHKEGQGVLKWADGSVYEGAFRGGKQHGTGYFGPSTADKKLSEWNQGNFVRYINPELD